VPPNNHHFQALRGLQHHNRRQAHCDHELQDLDVHARYHLDQHFVLDFVHQAVHNLVDQVLLVDQVFLDQLQQVELHFQPLNIVQDHVDSMHFLQDDFDALQLHQDFLHELEVHHLFEEHLDSLQLHQDVVDQLEVHHLLQVVDKQQEHIVFLVDQLQVQHLVEVFQHSLHNLFVVLQHAVHNLVVVKQALHIQQDFFKVLQQQDLNIVVPEFEVDFHQLGLHH
jgi:hypothetical protein